MVRRAPDDPTGSRNSSRGGPVFLLTGAVALVGLLSSTILPAQSGAKHPRLVSVDASRCATCHKDLLRSKQVVHEPVEDDCSNCHEMSIDETGTTVALLEGEPGLCVMCHDMEAAVEGELETPHYPVTESCLDCHDPHGTDQPNLLLSALPDLCSDCHDMEELSTTHSGQITEATNCVGCHVPHGNDNPTMLKGSVLHPPFEDGDCQSCHRPPFGTRVRLLARGERLCEACHGEMAEEGATSIHAALQGKKGRAGCLSCHDPHMAEQDKMLRQAAPDLCSECHPAIVAAVKDETGHQVGQFCSMCHRPHSAEQPNLLAESTPTMCTNCHAVEDPDLPVKHLGADTAKLDCVACHSPHGTGNMAQLQTYLHAAIEDGCDLCHEGASDELVEGGSSDLCLMCHDDIADLASTATVPHDALEMADCKDCHNPHASKQPRLVARPSGQICFDCHDDKEAEDGEVLHGVIDLIGCQACHEPHGGEGETLLRLQGSELCLACHGPRSVRLDDDGETATLLGRFEVSAAEAKTITQLFLSSDLTRNHPTTNHRVQGTATPEELHQTETTFEGELGCLSCHDPHKGKSSGLFLWDARSGLEVCVHCHEK